MARMSIDDKFLRDGRVKLLAQLMGWSRRETMGALLDVFAVAYDREEDVLPEAEIDAAAEKQGFVAGLIEVGLGEQMDDGIRIKGAAERIEYLAARREAGRKGGRKSGEKRRNQREAKRSTASEAKQARGNPPEPVPDPPPDPDPVPDRIGDPPLARTIPPSTEPGSVRTTVPEPTTSAAATDPPAPPERARDRERVWTELEVERQRRATELGVVAKPLLAFDPGRADLAGHLAAAPTREAYQQTVAAALHAVAIAGAEAGRDKTVEWLTGAVFSERTFRRLAGMTLADVERGGRRQRHGRPLAATADEIAAAKRVLAKLAELSGVATSLQAEHLQLVAAQLRAGVTEAELRAIAAYCDDEWSGDMRKHLRPEVLYDPTKIARYLDAARARYPHAIANYRPDGDPPDEPA